MINVGSTDRIIRLVAGLALLLLPFLPFAASLFAGMGVLKLVIAAIGGVLVLTALFRICPAYMLFGIRTCAVPKK